MICSKRLRHINPKLNEKHLWYVCVGESPEFYFTVIHSPTGLVSSAVHAVLKSDYVVEAIPTDEASDLF